MDKLFFDSWETLIRIVISSIPVYASIVILLKISGKRATSQLNNFDWIVTVMMGSIGASTVILKSVPIVEGMASIGMLLLLQFGVTKLATKSDKFASIILSDPAIVFYQGQFLRDAMTKERLTEQELMCAMREAGVHDPANVLAIVLESDAKLTVLKQNEDSDTSQTIKALVKSQF